MNLRYADKNLRSHKSLRKYMNKHCLENKGATNVDDFTHTHTKTNFPHAWVIVMINSLRLAPIILRTGAVVVINT